MSVQDPAICEIGGMLEKSRGQTPTGLCITDERGVLLYVNPVVERHLGSASAVAAGRTLCQVLCDHASLDAEAECPLGHGAASPRGCEGSVEVFSMSKNLRVRTLSLPAFLARNSRARYLALIDDVTMERELERSRDDWRNMIAHDLATPLLSMFAGLRFLEEALASKSLDPDESQLLQISLKACRRMTRMLDLFLNVVRLDAGLQVSSTNVSFFILLMECIEEHSPLIRSRRLEVEVMLLPPLLVRADSELLSRVIQNILNNAIKFSPEGGRITIGGSEGPEGMATVSFKDSGPGISGQEAPLIFNRFHRAKIWRENRVPGNGLGLAFCNQAVRAMGGDICAVAKPGEGGEFIVRLPLAMPESLPIDHGA